MKNRLLTVASLIILVTFLLSALYSIPQIIDEVGTWIRKGIDYTGYAKALQGHDRWLFDRVRGPDDKWIINLTISGYGYNPTTILVCDEIGYTEWQQNNFTEFYGFADLSFTGVNQQVLLTHNSTWYTILENSGFVIMYFTIGVILFIGNRHPSLQPALIRCFQKNIQAPYLGLFLLDYS